MRPHPLRALALAAALPVLIVGCDSNPDGPSGPSTSTAAAAAPAEGAGAPSTTTKLEGKRSPAKVNDMPGLKLAD